MTTINRWSETPSPVHPHIYGDRRECYPADMLAKRRAAFLARIAVYNAAAAVGVPAEIATDGELASPLETQKRRVRIVYASPLLVHHSALVDMKRKQDSE
jgi:antirestriction protein ArdC